jgi:hypothetical protein
MHTILSGLAKIRSVIAIGTVISFFILLADIAVAQDSWWNKGVDFLKKFGQEQNELTSGEIGEALKDALRVGTENVVSQLGRLDGFNTDSAVHIPLPDSLDKVRSMLNRIGMSSLLDDLELRLNRAAEEATPKAKELFWQAISEMTFDDVKAIYQGPEDAATTYFRNKMSPSLAQEIQPIIHNALEEVGAIQTYDKVIGQYQSLPLVPDVKANLTGYAIEKTMDGIFYYVAREEAAIRQDPAKRTTELLKRAFGT